MSANYDLKNKVAIVTGGAKGIGKAIALGLADSGAIVVVASRSKDELEAVTGEIKAKGGGATSVVTDLTVNEQIENLVETTVKTHQRVDILVNNAARSFLRPMMELREDGWDKIFNTNCKGAFLLSRAVAKVMMEQGGGRIINITTVGAVRGGAGMGVYHASKAALSMLTKCMAVEWAPFNINVNAVGPGLTKTAFSQPIWANPEVEKGIAARIPKGRLAEPEEVVGAVLFLCSEESSFITGQSIYVDGGTLANA
ncbi:MAG: SDR family oxidoreductase [Deltaproteobacteria bacterium]|nr:SDR family oxidoreductase [Deltaproteobacteria bacterium]MBW2053710.1 SDR family oxidoreductase [Deltaproteobacteria bacterium]MBW2139437.1 SDR family oxidoreductase [Deltaproteobacteria bacterium]MBW2323860.1 SDR family oxidoreductase [Deltaproteobacteria bacterium]